MGHMPRDVMAEELHPLRIVAVHGTGELALCCVPLLPLLEGDVGRGVVHDCECGHPEMVAEPRAQPILHDSKPTKVGNDEREGHCGKSSTRGPRHQDLHRRHHTLCEFQMGKSVLKAGHLEKLSG